MYTCVTCSYALTIGKVTSQLTENNISISDPTEFIKMFVNKRKKQDQADNILELNFDINALNSAIQKANLKTDVSTVLITKYNNIKKNMRPNTFCLNCSYCNETFVLPPGVLLTFKLKKTNNNQTILNIDDLISDNTLHRTKDFICSNKECENTHPDKEAIIYRPDPDEFITQYLCVNCKTIF